KNTRSSCLPSMFRSVLHNHPRTHRGVSQSEGHALFHGSRLRSEGAVGIGWSPGLISSTFQNRKEGRSCTQGVMYLHTRSPCRRVEGRSFGCPRLSHPYHFTHAAYMGSRAQGSRGSVV